jgi:hypothetical protein
MATLRDRGDFRMLDKTVEVKIEQLIGIDQEYELFISIHHEDTESIEICQYPMGMMYRVKYADGKVVLINPVHIVEVVIG